MDRYTLLKKIITFPLIATSLAEELLSGDFQSMFRGQGIEADEVRRYERGDDVRAIDWNVSARFGNPYVKMYREERDLVLSLVIDCSPSMFCGGTVTCYDQAVLAVALLAFSAEKAGLRVSALFYARKIMAAFPPRRGRSHIMACISTALHMSPSGKGSNLGATLAAMQNTRKRRSLVVIISDFHTVNWEAEFSSLCQKHEVLAIRITDHIEEQLPEIGLVIMRDPETEILRYAQTRSQIFRDAWTQWHEDRQTLWYAVCRRAGARPLSINTAEEVSGALIHFFKNRIHRSGE
ncbi:hypothetical protein PilKf_02489 [Pillotina sp. SPG140]|jgi:uncharacterized protein (DUF58 family)